MASRRYGVNATGIARKGEIARLARAFRAAMLVALYEEALDIFVESQEEVPVDTGRLRGSGLVTARRGFDPNVVVSYGTAYALAVHERRGGDAGRQSRAELALSNPGYKPRGSTTGKSKYLEDPLKRAAAGMHGRLQKRVKAIVASGRSSQPTPNVRGSRRR